MATYNGSKFIEAQIGSIHKELEGADELIVVDDHSQDNTPQIVTDILNSVNGPLGDFVSLDQNIGHRAAFAKAISLASNPVVALSDQDDLWPRGRLAALSRCLDRSGADLAFGSLLTFGSGSPRCLKNAPVDLRGWTGLCRYLASALGVFEPRYSFGSACAFRRSAIDTSIPITMETHEQWLVVQALTGRGIAYTPDVVTFRRLHPQNMTIRRGMHERGPALLRTSIRMLGGMHRSRRRSR